MNASEYAEEITALARSLEEQCQESGSDVSDVLHEMIDGHQWVIYTHLAREVLLHSDNDCEIFDVVGPVEVSDWGTLFSQAAYFAMVSDVSGEIDEDACEEKESTDDDD